eukprot:3708257-Pyramimonas_sp.AAC.1
MAAHAHVAGPRRSGPGVQAAALELPQLGLGVLHQDERRAHQHGHEPGAARVHRVPAHRVHRP